ncbi:MAG TPA: hypothetical protein VGJ00_10325 [Rhabdochlamydiaceae bacterium]|jgi:hypothetical protein
MSWFSEIFGGGHNPANAAMPYINQIPGATNQYMQPYFQAGTNALPGLQDQYKNLLNDPGGMTNKIGQGYQESPGFKFALQQALNAGNNAQAAGGMSGTPQHQFQAMQEATGLANQDYGNWMNRALGLYGSGLTGQQNMAGMGQQAGSSLANMIAQTLAQQGNIAFQGDRQQNQNRNDAFSNIFNTIGAFAGFNPWHMLGNI